jgi:hypothetical protein
MTVDDARVERFRQLLGPATRLRRMAAAGAIYRQRTRALAAGGGASAARGPMGECHRRGDQQRGAEQRLKIAARRFRPVERCISEKEARQKPDPRIFVWRWINWAARETVMIGDAWDTDTGALMLASTRLVQPLRRVALIAR